MWKVVFVFLESEAKFAVPGKVLEQWFGQFDYPPVEKNNFSVLLTIRDCFTIHPKDISTICVRLSYCLLKILPLFTGSSLSSLICYSLLTYLQEVVLLFVWMSVLPFSQKPALGLILSHSPVYSRMSYPLFMILFYYLSRTILQYTQSLF